MDGLTRRGVLSLGAVGAAVGVVGLERLTTAGAFERAATAQAAWPSTVGLLPSGGLVTIAGGDGGGGGAGGGDAGDGGPVLVAGSRVVSDAVSGTDAVTAAVQAEQRWLASGNIPGEGGPFEDMARAALLDLRVMLRPRGALLDSWARGRGVVVPRTAAFAAAALAATGHADDALHVLYFLAAAQQIDGTFFDSYPPEQSSPGTPDQIRGREDRPENAGWALWAVNETMRGLPERRTRGFSSPLRSLITRSFVKILNDLGADGLPPPPPGYANGLRRPLELATAAPMLAGLQAAVELEQRGGGRVQTFAIADAAVRFDEAITGAFGPDYPSTRGSSVPDESVTFLMPPIGFSSDSRLTTVLRRVDAGLVRPRGLIVPGRALAPTAPVALVALADSYSDAAYAKERALATLRWLDQHRTAHGSLPEAVQFNGVPAGPAPYAWTAAIVLLILSGPASWP